MFKRIEPKFQNYLKLTRNKKPTIKHIDGWGKIPAKSGIDYEIRLIEEYVITGFEEKI